MITKRKFLLLILEVVTVLLLGHHGLYASTVRADPDFISTGIEYSGVPAVKIGDNIKLGSFSLGGMVEVRNEERFNQGMLPNHNWRGFVFACYDRTVYAQNENTGVVTAGFEHESAHPTMGLNEPTDDPYQMIYDGTYRNINLNSFLLRYCHELGDSSKLKIHCDLQFYFYSRNTPELPYTDTGWSEGLSGGAEYGLQVSGQWKFFASVFDRYIFQGPRESRRDIYCSEGGTVVARNRLYPVINNVNTISFKTGITYGLNDSGTQVSLYGSAIYGNIYGFVDSRDKRIQYAIGIDFVH